MLISDAVTGNVDLGGIKTPYVALEDELADLLAVDEDTGQSDGVVDDEETMDEAD